MKKSLLRFIVPLIVTLFITSMIYSCGSGGSTGIVTAPPISVTLTLIPSSGTLDAVNVDSTFSEVIPASAGIVNPNSIQISIVPSFLFTEETYSNYVEIIPSASLQTGTTFSVTTNFLTIQNGTLYAATAYNAFTTSTTP